jgi:hypothetical protein
MVSRKIPTDMPGDLNTQFSSDPAGNFAETFITVVYTRDYQGSNFQMQI